MSFLLTLWVLVALYTLKVLLTPVVREARRAYRRRQPCPLGVDHDTVVCGVCLRRWSR